MPLDRMERLLVAELRKLEAEGRRKGREAVISGIVPATATRGPRFLIEGEGEKAVLRMNANNYLGLSLREEVVAAEHEGVRRLGAGPGAVRFISGTWAPHIELERKLAAFHGREAAMIFSSAYAAVMGILPPLITPDTAVVSDELNHNCIINAIRLARPRERHVYRHLDLRELEARLDEAARACKRAIVVTDGVFSMRGDHAPLKEIEAIARKHDGAFAENVLVVVDDSHGVGALGATGRGTEEVTGARVDVLVATLGKAFGVNGGYVAAGGAEIDYLREVSPFYVYSNPIAPGEAAAAARAVAIVDGPAGRGLIGHLRDMAARFRDGLKRLGYETIPGEHPIVPLMVRDTGRTAALVRHLRQKGILATGLGFPVVPRGDEEIRFQICADHTPADIDEVLAALTEFDGGARGAATP
jgi:glycine C-acetyltransferase